MIWSCHFPSILGISYIVIPRKLSIFKYWSYNMYISNLDFGDFDFGPKYRQNRGITVLSKIQNYAKKAE